MRGDRYLGAVREEAAVIRRVSGGAWLMARLSDPWVSRPTGRDAEGRASIRSIGGLDLGDCRDHYAMSGFRDRNDHIRIRSATNVHQIGALGASRSVGR